MAIDDLLDEHEQGERVRSWLQRNGASILGGVAIGLAIIWGWKWWQARQVTEQMRAAEQYETLVDASGAAADPAKLAAGLTKLPADSMYGALARMQLAKAQVDAGKPADALVTLRAIKADSSGLANVVNVRIGRLLVETGKPAEAVTLLSTTNTAAAQEVVGDAEAKQGRNDAAQAAYTKALTQLEVGTPERSIVELKLADVGGTPPDTQPKTGAAPAATAATAPAVSTAAASSTSTNPTPSAPAPAAATPAPAQPAAPAKQ